MPAADEAMLVGLGGHYRRCGADWIVQLPGAGPHVPGWLTPASTISALASDVFRGGRGDGIPTPILSAPGAAADLAQLPAQPGELLWYIGDERRRLPNDGRAEAASIGLLQPPFEIVQAGGLVESGLRFLILLPQFVPGLARVWHQRLHRQLAGDR